VIVQSRSFFQKGGQYRLAEHLGLIFKIQENLALQRNGLIGWNGLIQRRLKCLAKPFPGFLPSSCCAHRFLLEAS
jgi:hypothetical protein